MSYLFFFLILALNFWISWSNASCVGRYWTESKQVGGSFRRLIVCGYVMAIAGFTMVYADILVMLLPIVMGPRLSPSSIDFLQEMTAGISYLLTGAAIIFSGFRITANSLKNAWQQRTFSYIANAGWNSYAQIHNAISYARTAPGIIGRIFKSLAGGDDDDDAKGKLVVLALLLVVLAILGGYFTANAIMKRADAQYNAFEEAYMEHQRQLEAGN